MQISDQDSHEIALNVEHRFENNNLGENNITSEGVSYLAKAEWRNFTKLWTCNKCITH